jgi:hypothetical protein
LAADALQGRSPLDAHEENRPGLAGDGVVGATALEVRDAELRRGVGGELVGREGERVAKHLQCVHEIVIDLLPRVPALQPANSQLDAVALGRCRPPLGGTARRRANRRRYRRSPRLVLRVEVDQDSSADERSTPAAPLKSSSSSTVNTS